MIDLKINSTNNYENQCGFIVYTGVKTVPLDENLDLNNLVILPPTQHHSFFRNLPPFCRINAQVHSEVSDSFIKAATTTKGSDEKRVTIVGPLTFNTIIL